MPVVCLSPSVFRQPFCNAINFHDLHAVHVFSDICSDSTVLAGEVQLHHVSDSLAELQLSCFTQTLAVLTKLLLMISLLRQRMLIRYASKYCLQLNVAGVVADWRTAQDSNKIHANADACRCQCQLRLLTTHTPGRTAVAPSSLHDDVARHLYGGRNDTSCPRQVLASGMLSCPYQVDMQVAQHTASCCYLMLSPSMQIPPAPHMLCLHCEKCFYSGLGPPIPPKSLHLTCTSTVPRPYLLNAVPLPAAGKFSSSAACSDAANGKPPHPEIPGSNLQPAPPSDKAASDSPAGWGDPLQELPEQVHNRTSPVQDASARPPTASGDTHQASKTYHVIYNYRHTCCWQKGGVET